MSINESSFLRNLFETECSSSKGRKETVKKSLKKPRSVTYFQGDTIPDNIMRLMQENGGILITIDPGSPCQMMIAVV